MCSNSRLGVGKFHFTLGGDTEHFLYLALGLALAKSLTFALEKSVLLRLPLQQGIPYAISKFTYYILLVLVIMAAILMQWRGFE